MEKIIGQFPNYKIDVNGNVYSRYKYKTGIVCDKWRKLKPVLDKGTGYYLVTLVHDGYRKNQFIHRLIASAFIPNPENKPQVNHIDGDKTNNDIKNLEWVTAKENLDHAIRIGLHDKGRLRQCNPIVQYTKDGIFIKEFLSACHASRELDVPQSNILKVLKGRRKIAGGFHWKYKETSETIPKGSTLQA